MGVEIFARKYPTFPSEAVKRRFDRNRKFYMALEESGRLLYRSNAPDPDEWIYAAVTVYRIGEGVPTE